MLLKTLGLASLVSLGGCNSSQPAAPSQSANASGTGASATPSAGTTSVPPATGPTTATTMTVAQFQAALVGKWSTHCLIAPNAAQNPTLAPTYFIYSLQVGASTSTLTVTGYNDSACKSLVDPSPPKPITETITVVGPSSSIPGAFDLNITDSLPSTSYSIGQINGTQLLMGTFTSAKSGTTQATRFNQLDANSAYYRQ